MRAKSSCKELADLRLHAEHGEIQWSAGGATDGAGGDVDKRSHSDGERTNPLLLRWLGQFTAAVMMAAGLALIFI